MSEDTKHNVAPEDDIHPVSKALFGWVGTKGIGKIIFWLLAVISVVLLVLDFFVVRHPHFTIEGTKGFYGFVGFTAFTFLVLSGWPLGKLLRRDENYYGDADDGEDH